MTIAQTDASTPRKPLRLWPGVLAAVLLLLIRYVAPAVNPETMIFAVIGGLAGGLVIVVWWAFFSRAPGAERWGAVLLMIVALVATSRLLHESIAGGMMGMMFPVYAFPLLSLAFAASVAAGHRLSDGPRRAVMVAAILLASGAWALLRTGGITGEADSDLHWRWSQTPEERLLAQGGAEPAAIPADVPAPAAAAAPAVPGAVAAQEEPLVAEEPAVIPPAEAAAEADWPGFRGPGRDGIVRGVRIATDWSASPPVELWRRPIGPGWSSFAVRGDRLYTQEQRGDDEIVACYDVTTGEPVWGHRDAARFWESNGGAGPRATPTLSNGRVYAFGATGILNVLDARDGAVVWSRNPASDTGTEIPGWGFASSPLVVGDIVIVAVGGKLVAYDLATGEPRWYGPAAGAGYSSPHLATIDGVAQVLLLSTAGATSVAPADGAQLWQHPWPAGTRIVQPALTADGDVLIGANEGIGRIALAHGAGGWTVKERWTSIGLKPYFNDFVVHHGHAFGFDGSMLASIDLETGKRTWKGGRYGHGQLVLLPDQDLLLVLSEQGELALVKATPDQFTELARFPAIQGKTWNHPVLAGDVLLVRNDQEMVAFRLVRAGRPDRQAAR
ncbi:MAG: PQQ-binding-like beta-propeller repeat protein [Thermoanaerobaculia bacterium]